MQPRRIVLLVGAHKTASTHLQRTLERNAATLAGDGVGLMLPKQVRRALTPLTFRLRDGEDPARLRAIARRHLDPGLARLVIADENILGGTEPHMLWSDAHGPYPWGPGRTARIADLLHPAQVEIGIAVRAPASFLVSAYGEDLHHSGPRPFRQFLPTQDLAAFRWSRLIRRVRDNTACAIVVWRFEDYPAVLPAIAGWAVGRSDLDIPRQRYRTGPSAQAIERLLAAAPSKRPGEALQILKRRFPKSAAYPGPSPWSAGELALLKRSYSDDLSEIAALAGVTLLAPAGA